MDKGTAMTSCKKVSAIYKLHCNLTEKLTLTLTTASTLSNLTKSPIVPQLLQVKYHQLANLNEQFMPLLASGLVSHIAILRNVPYLDPAVALKVHARNA